MTTAMLHNIRTRKEERKNEKNNKTTYFIRPHIIYDFTLIQWEKAHRESGGIKLKLYCCHLIYAVPMRRNFLNLAVFLPHSFVSSIDAKNPKLRRTDPEIRQIYNVYITMCSSNVFQHKSSKTMLVFCARHFPMDSQKFSCSPVLCVCSTMFLLLFFPFYFVRSISSTLCVCACLFFVNIQSFPFEIDRSRKKNQIATYPARSRQMYTI